MATPFLIEAARVPKPRLSEVLFERMDRRFGSIAELPSNVEAIEAGLLFAVGLNPFVAILGPSGWGKTHLLECVANHMQREFGTRTKIISAFDWIEGRHTADAHLPLLLDDVQEAMTRTRSRVQLRLGLERRVRIGRPTMLAATGDGLARQLLGFLPSRRDWGLHEIGQPTSSERKTVVEKMAAAEKLEVSKVLATLLATRMKGNGNTLHGALNRLKLAGNKWSMPNEVLNACGILDPFFADNSAWDLKEKVRTAADKTARQFPKIDSSQLSCFAMIHTAHLCELDVARFCGLEPAKARAQSIKFQKSLSDSDSVESAYLHFLNTVVESLPES